MQRRFGLVATLAVSGMVVSLAGRASGTTFEKAINPNYSYTEDVQQTSDGGYVACAGSARWNVNIQDRRRNGLGSYRLPATPFQLAERLLGYLRWSAHRSIFSVKEGQ